MFLIQYKWLLLYENNYMAAFVVLEEVSQKGIIILGDPQKFWKPLV